MRTEIIYAVFGITACFTLAYFNYSTPQCVLGLDSEAAMSSGSVLLFLIVMFPLLFIANGGFNKKQKRGLKYTLFIVMIFFIITPTVMIGTGRSGETERNYWEFNGIIAGKFISKNHSSKSLVIDGKEYEFIPEKIWNFSEVGNHAQKDICSNININGSEFKFGK